MKPSPKRNWRLHSKELEHSRSRVRDVGERIPRIGQILEDDEN